MEKLDQQNCYLIPQELSTLLNNTEIKKINCMFFRRKIKQGIVLLQEHLIHL